MASGDLARARARYQRAREAAWTHAKREFAASTGLQCEVTNWSLAAREAYEKQWPPMPREPLGWEWQELFRRNTNRMDHLDVVLWGPNGVLCGLGIADTTETSVFAHVFEGSPDKMCPLKGHRIGIYLETVAAFGQALGKKELKIQPLNSILAELYVDTYGFELVTTPKGQQYYRREI